MSQPSSADLLAQQLSQLSALETLLLAEKEVLQKNDADRLVALTEEKSTLLKSIEEFDASLATNQQFLADRKGGLLENEMAQIQAALTKCQELNEVNGQIINHSQLAVERLKTSIIERHNKSSMTYDSKGKKSAGLSSLGLKA
ncbi:flagella synthesis protein FlgN [Thalassotalea euphylliae]|uniref:flagella synthesis protein FlgN n=1 Tax=Thalassotalea euphylliae TaxID=1655234 RepID=UPI00362F972E